MTHAAAPPLVFQADIDNQSETTFWVWLVIDVCNDVLWFADIAFNFRTGFFKKGVLVMHPRDIALNYIKFWF